MTAHEKRLIEQAQSYAKDLEEGLPQLSVAKAMAMIIYDKLDAALKAGEETQVTIDQFVKRLAKTPREWKLTCAGHIRFPVKDYMACPITFLKKAPEGKWRLVADMLGITTDDAEAIVDAADYPQPSDRKLRKDLLRACGLEGKRK